MNNIQHAYVGQLANAIDLEIEILVCGYCACWFGVDSDSLATHDVDLACHFCYKLAPVEEAAATPRQIHLWEEISVVIEEVERAVYGCEATDSGGDNPPSHYDTPDDITEWEPIEGTDIYEN